MEKFKYQESAEKPKPARLSDGNRKRLFDRISESSNDDEARQEETKKVKMPITPQAILTAFQTKEYEKCLEMMRTVEANGSINVAGSEFVIMKAACWTMLDINHEEILKTLNDLIEKEPRNSFAHYGLGLFQYRQANLSACISTFATVVNLNGTRAMMQALEFKGKAKAVIDLMNKGKSFEFILRSELVELKLF